MFWESVSIPCMVSGYLPHVISQVALGVQELSHLQKAPTKAHLTTLNLMEAEEFTLKYKLGHDPSRARVPPADSPGNK